MLVESIFSQIYYFTLDLVKKGGLILFFRRPSTAKDAPGLVRNVDSQVCIRQYQECCTSVVFELESLTSLFLSLHHNS